VSDYANCPTCHGRGVVPLETAQAIETHAQANTELAREEAATRRREAEEKLRRDDLAARLEAKQKRRQRQLLAAASGPELTPDQLADLAARLRALLDGLPA
jgi:hypothetical protein